MALMDYSQFKILEFRRKFFKIFGAEISITDPSSNRLVGYIKMKAWKLNADIGVFTDKSMQQAICNIGSRQLISFKPSYNILDTATQQPIATLVFRRLRTALVRGHVDIIDNQGNPYGYAQETSSILAIARRWLEILPLGDYIGLIFMFVPQTFDIMYAPNGNDPKIAGKIVHRKNPIIVKMSLNTNQAQISLDPRISIGLCTVLSIRDANKNI
jgi:hypothetical protein